MENILQDWAEKMKKHSELINSGKTGEESLREVWGNEEAEKILFDIAMIEKETI